MLRHLDPRDDGSELVGTSAPMLALKRRIEQVGSTEATVLILGERGVGKELVATALHRASRRRARPVVTINCAALPVELLASELFGHERGAFTGAVQRSPGLLPAADGGTVFLDEIGDLSLAGQSMLLRFLQGREVRALGATTSARVDVRVLAATNVNLDDAVRDGAFRPDLYDRLNAVTVCVPPLRRRREDLTALVEHLLRKQAQRHDRPVPCLGADVMRVLETYPWPGNVRELEFAMSRAVIFADGGLVEVRDLGLPVSSAVANGLTARQRDILRLATVSRSIRRADLIRRYGISGEAARCELLRLVRLGLLERIGRYRGTHYASRFTQETSHERSSASQGRDEQT